MINAKAVLLCTLLTLSPAIAKADGPGALRGTVTDPQGRPLAAVVRYMSVVPSVASGLRATPAPDETVVTGSAVVDSTGAFSVPSLPSGTYMLCASVASQPYIDPCVWRHAIRSVVLAGGAAEANLVLEMGAYLNVRINDPGALLPQVIDGPLTPRRLLVGVAFARGGYQGATNTDVDPAGRSYRLIIPAGESFYLRLFSTDLALTDASGGALSAPAAAVAFEASAGQEQNFTFTVSGTLDHGN